MDHIIFKHNAYAIILQEDTEAAAKIATHQNCRLGKWYVTDAKENFGATQAYKAIETSHLIVHDQVFKAVTCIKDKSCVTTSRERVIGNMATVERESFKLFDLFAEMVKEGNPDVKL